MIALIMLWFPSTSPQANFLDSSLFEIIEQIFPGLLIFAISDAKGQDLPFARFCNSYHGQNRHLAPFIAINDGEVRPISKGIRVTRLQWAFLPLSGLALSRMEHA